MSGSRSGFPAGPGSHVRMPPFLSPSQAGRRFRHVHTTWGHGINVPSSTLNQSPWSSHAPGASGSRRHALLADASRLLQVTRAHMVLCKESQQAPQESKQSDASAPAFVHTNCLTLCLAARSRALLAGHVSAVRGVIHGAGVSGKLGPVWCSSVVRLGGCPLQRPCL